MTSPKTNSSQHVPGTVASSGVAHGKLFLLDPEPVVNRTGQIQTGNQVDIFTSAVSSSCAQLRRLSESMEDHDDALELLEFQMAMLEDESLAQSTVTRINAGEAATQAWTGVMDAEIQDYADADDEYFRARATDLTDIRNRVLRSMLGIQDRPIPGGCIAVGEELTPTQFLSTEWGQGGVALTGGSVTGHVALLARARGVPMLVKLDSLPETSDVEVFLDAHAGALITAPTDHERRQLRQREADDERARNDVAAYLNAPAVTPGGRRIAVLVNFADPMELTQVDPSVCDGVGLVRTELLFRDTTGLPTEEKQFQTYRQFVEWADGKPVTIRTLDAGGDKPIPGLTRVGETNPFLGIRGIRLSLMHKQIFRTQLRALLRASVLGPLKIMLPMITSPDELKQVRELLADEVANMRQADIPVGSPDLGVMIEVPSAAITIDEFDADFYSIGSNDLVQYVTACSRDVDELQHLARSDNSAVLRLIEQVVTHGRATGKQVSVCGEMAGTPEFTKLLLGRGVEGLSVAPSALARTKHAVVTMRNGNDNV